MHWEILDSQRQVLLTTLADSISIKDCYMAGGTALSLQMKLRKSVDFDFFVPHPFSTDELLFQIRALYPTEIKVLQHQSHTLDLNIQGVQVSFFHYPYPMTEDFYIDQELPSLKMASPEDIAAMKMSAIGSRGARKDFFDLYHICLQKKISPRKMYDILQKKFGTDIDFSYMVMGLSYFEDAEHETLPNVFVRSDWKKIKTFFLSFAEEMQDIIVNS